MSYSPGTSGAPLAQVSAIEPLSPALDWTKNVLSPFSFSFWLNVTFCLFLSMLGQGGIPNLNIFSGRGTPMQGGANWQEMAQRTLDYLGSAEGATVMGLMALGVFLGLLLYAGLVFLSSRGTFMFLNCIVTGRDDVAAPWRDFSRMADSLFLLRLSIEAIYLVVLIPSVLLIARQVLVAVAADEFDGLMTGTVFLFGIGLLLAGLAKSVIGFLIGTLVVPRMYRRRESALQAIPAAWALLMRYPVEVLAFAGMRLLVLIGVSIVAGVLGCILCCIIWIPVVGMIPLMPLYFYVHSYSILWLEQFGPEWEIFDRSQVPPPGPSGSDGGYGGYSAYPSHAAPAIVRPPVGPATGYQYQESPPPTAFTGSVAPGGYGYPPQGYGAPPSAPSAYGPPSSYGAPPQGNPAPPPPGSIPPPPPMPPGPLDRPPGQ